jgi:osmotically-inducible protein OsmY
LERRAMAGAEQVVKQLRKAAGSDPRVDLRHLKIDFDPDAGIATLEGEVPNVAMKRLALRRVGAVPAVTDIVDRIRVRPAERLGDGAVRDLVCDVLAQEPALQLYEIRQRTGDRVETVRGAPPEPGGFIEFTVEEGVVTLTGRVLGLEAKRLAGVLAWWVPGSRDVINGLGVEPPEPDSDDAIANAVRLVLERDPLVDEAHVHVGVQDAVVTLAGILPDEAQREMAEFDAWYVFGVDDVVNDIEVHRY